MIEDLRDAVTAMNALPDISHNDSQRLQGFTRTTALEIRAAGGVGAATSLEMIGYIRELEQELHSRALVVAPQGDSEAKAKEIVEEYKQRVIQLPSGDAVPSAKWLETRLRIAFDLVSPASSPVPPDLHAIICPVIAQHCQGIQLPKGIVGLENDLIAALQSSSPVPPEQKDGWVTFGRVKVDIENETETFERIHPPAATPAPVEQERDDLISRKAAIDLINVCTCGSGPEFRSVGMRHHAVMCQTYVATFLRTLPAVAPSPSVREAAEAIRNYVDGLICAPPMRDFERDEIERIINKYFCPPVPAAGGDEQCAWTLDDSNDGAFWETGCGEAFRFTDGGPTENHFTFCYKCGKRISVGRYSDTVDSVGEEGK